MNSNEKTLPGVPSGPAAPLEPSAPVRPGRPWLPLGPVGPGQPSNPFWPLAPDGPGKPSCPGVPSTPRNPRLRGRDDQQVILAIEPKTCEITSTYTCYTFYRQRKTYYKYVDSIKIIGTISNNRIRLLTQVIYNTCEPTEPSTFIYF